MTDAERGRETELRRLEEQAAGETRADLVAMLDQDALVLTLGTVAHPREVRISRLPVEVYVRMQAKGRLEDWELLAAVLGVPVAELTADPPAGWGVDVRQAQHACMLLVDRFFIARTVPAFRAILRNPAAVELAYLTGRTPSVRSAGSMDASPERSSASRPPSSSTS